MHRGCARFGEGHRERCSEGFALARAEEAGDIQTLAMRGNP
jgi:hypothetical protein